MGHSDTSVLEDGDSDSDRDVWEDTNMDLIVAFHHSVILRQLCMDPVLVYVIRCWIGVSVDLEDMVDLDIQHSISLGVS
jgi:hypothetical protein